MPPRKKRKITAEDLYKFELISHIRISPDGENVVYVVQRIDQKSEKKYSNLWIVPTKQGPARRFTFGDQTDTHPRWSPDGTQIAFLSNRGNKEKAPQIYLIPFQGGEAYPLTDIKGEIGGFSWSPDGQNLVCSVRKTDPEVLEREQDENRKKLGTVARHYDRVFYKFDSYGYLPKERTHLWVINARTGKSKQITDHAIYDERNPAWSPDGKTIAFLSNRTPDPDFDPDNVGLYTIPAGGGEIKEISTKPGEKALPSFSPNGKWIAYFGQDGKNRWYRNQELWIVPADGSKNPKSLTKKYDLHIDSVSINDLGEPELMPPTWSLDSKTIYFQIVLHGSSILKSITINEGEPSTVIDENTPGGDGSVIGSYSFDDSQEQLAYFQATLQDPGQVYTLHIPTGKSKKLSSHNQRLLDSLDLGTIETHWIKGDDGNDLQGWILKPPGFKDKKKYPSILEIHGGPLTQYGYIFFHEFYYLAAQGYVVHFSNPRGGRGYGEKHAAAIWKDWGNADYRDIMAWTDYVEQQPYIDKNKMGVTGGSYGGYMTVWIIGHTNRYKAAVTQRCVSNLISMWGSSDFNWAFENEFSDKPPYESFEKFWKHSPIRYIGNATTPTLVIHSENDLRCPIEQGEQVFVALRRQGVESEMVRFPEEFHGLSRGGRTDRRIERLNHIVRWFDKYM